jgi:hypothetical protein
MTRIVGGLLGLSSVTDIIVFMISECQTTGILSAMFILSTGLVFTIGLYLLVEDEDED